MSSKKKLKFNTTLISPNQAERLRQEILIDKEYLGSSFYEYVFGQTSNELYHLLFDGHSKKLYEQEKQRPSIILGRRGAGKSTYLNHLSSKENVIPIALRTWDLIDIVEGQVSSVLENQDGIDVEKTADIWHFLFLTFTCIEVSKIFPKDEVVSDFLNQLPLKNLATDSFKQVASALIKKLKKTYLETNARFDLELVLQAMAVSLKTLDSLEKSISNTLLNKQCKIAILMLDNPERFARGVNKNVSLRSKDDSREATISGLLNLVGRFNKGHHGVQVRLCVPAEQIFYLKDVSESKRKDFGSTQLLHWNSGELLSMSAHRYLIFLTVYPEYRDRTSYLQLLDIPIYTRKGAIKFWRYVLEDETENSRNLCEDTLTFLLRHTQLLPRQLLDYLNFAVDASIKDGSCDLTVISSKTIRSAVENIEQSNAYEVIDSYTYSYPEANDMFKEVIPRLPMITSVKEVLDDLYKSSGAKGVLNQHKKHPLVTVNKRRFLRLLLETGVYGKVIRKPSEHATGYIVAEYEYTLPDTMQVSDNDMLARHPLFSGQISPPLYSMVRNDVLGIYPIGTDCHD